ncbi:MAG: membrane protein insertase YidC [Oscillospiraceae bacterium]|jgi:YidC/Oxa1 family membrane protein insertase|nr:membrane protein insertase YidC [Oscillospiraceae bacterium]
MWLYDVFQNYGVAVILFAVIVKIILLPFQMKAKRGMLKTQRIQPLVKELEKKHGANKQIYQRELAKLYREESVSPTGGCLWTLIPFPILIALYQAIRYPLTTMMGVPAALISKAEGAVGAIAAKLSELGFVSKLGAAYEQIDQAQFITKHFDDFRGLSDKLQKIDYNFLGLNLGVQPSFKVWALADYAAKTEISVTQAFFLFLIPVISAAFSLLSALYTQKRNPAQASATGAAASSGGMMLVMVPLMSLWFGFMMPAALSVYWAIGTVLGFVQELWLNAHYKKILDAEDEIKNARRREREDELSRKAAETERLRSENATEVNRNTSKKKQDAADRAERERKQAEYDRRQKNEPSPQENPARVGERKFARGRAYDPTRFEDGDAADEPERYLLTEDSGGEPARDGETSETGD